MQLRAYSPEDQDALVSLWFESAISIGLRGPMAPKSELAERVSREIDGRWNVTVAEANGQIVGFLALALTENRLDQLFVAPDSQGQGIGRALFQVARELLPNGFWLSTQPENMRAQRFYQRNGMTLARTEPSPHGGKLIYELSE